MRCAVGSEPGTLCHGDGGQGRWPPLPEGIYVAYPLFDNHKFRSSDLSDTVPTSPDMMGMRRRWAIVGRWAEHKGGANVVDSPGRPHRSRSVKPP